jgi:hypothetical protein
VSIIEAPVQEGASNKRRNQHSKTHGKSGTPTYMSWAMAKQNALLGPEFNDFRMFLRYLGERPRGYRLARHDDSKLHSPSNSFWKQRVIR